MSNRRHRGVPGRPRRREDLIARTRRLFCWAAVASIVLTLPGAVVGRDLPALVGVVLASGVLVVLWTLRRRRGRVTWGSDVLEAVTSAVFATCAASPELAFGFVFTAMWQRALYGGWLRGTVHAGLLCTSLVVALFCWPLLHGHGDVDSGGVLGPLPLTFLISAVARYLAANLFAREQAAARQSALADLSAALLCAQDRQPVVDAAWTALTRVCSATPGTAALGVEERHDGQDGGVRLRVYAVAGTFRDLRPLDLPVADVLSLAPSPHPVPRDLADTLHAVDPGPAEWVSLPLPVPPGSPARWLLIGGPGVDDVVPAAQTITRQATLALRACGAHEQLVAAARTDALTGLANRVAFSTALDAALPSRPAVLFCDLDGFKQVNDVLGHGVGDDLLRAVAARITSVVRPTDVCARLGGDEFVVLLHDAGEDVVDAVSRRLVERVSAPYTVDGRQVRIGVSVGSTTARDGATVAVLLQQADEAMYRAKRHRKAVAATGGTGGA